MFHMFCIGLLWNEFLLLAYFSGYGPYSLVLLVCVCMCVYVHRCAYHNLPFESGHFNNIMGNSKIQKFPRFVVSVCCYHRIMCNFSSKRHMQKVIPSTVLKILLFKNSGLNTLIIWLSPRMFFITTFNFFHPLVRYTHPSYLISNRFRNILID